MRNPAHLPSTDDPNNSWRGTKITKLRSCNYQPIPQQDRQCGYKATFKPARVTIVAVEKQGVLHIVSVCLYPWSSSTQRARAGWPYVACPAQHYSSTLSHKRHEFRGGKK